MRSFLFWLTGFLPCRIISDGSTPYLERYYLFTVLGWRFYLHRFVGSDPDRGLHDHPWSRAFSIILSGWYWEETRTGTRRVAWFNTLTGDTFHRVVLPMDTLYGLLHARPKCCWTLFFHRAENVKEWGFLKVIPDTDGVSIFEPYRYTRDGNQRRWWLKAPKGRDEPRRVR